MKFREDMVTVIYFGLMITAPKQGHIAVDEDGAVSYHERDPEYLSCCRANMGAEFGLTHVDLEGADWKETRRLIKGLDRVECQLKH